MARHELTTKDGSTLEDLLQMTRRLVDIYNDAERPFRDMFAETVSQQTFYQEVPDEDLFWEEIAEGEHPRTMVSDDEEGKWITIRGKTYAKGLGFSREFVRKSSDQEVMRKVNRMLSGAKNTEDKLIRDTFHTSIADGSGVWYDIPDYGAHEFTADHNHVFADTDSLFDNDGTDDTSYAAHEHLEEAKKELTHHGFTGDMVALISSDFKRRLRNEVTWDASYHIPMATNLRSSSLEELDIRIDGIRLMVNPWITGDEFYLTEVQNGKPVKFLEDEAVTVIQPNEAEVRSPGDLLGAKGYARYGCRGVDPLRTVHVTGTNFTN